MKTSLFLSLTAATLLALAGPALSGTGAGIPGQKLDSGLGGLPHYAQWADPSGRDPMDHHVRGESLDDGLGELPHYSQWVDPTGRDPLGPMGTGVADAER